MEKKNTYDWRFKAIGGTSRVDISCGEDIRHLGQLDRKLWTVLSCPASGLEFDHKTLEIIDSDKDGKIRVGEIVSAADYLTSAIKNADLLLEGKDTIALSDFNVENPAGKRLYDSAKRVLSNLGLEKDSISLSDTADSVAIFKGTKFNGDGVITAASTDDEALAKVIGDMVSTVGGVADRSGAEGVDEPHIEAFYAACADYSAWIAAGEAEGVHPFGADTDAACGALEAMAAKVDDYFIRCNLAAFDADSAPALDVQVSSISEISSRNLTDCTDAISSYPLARISGRSTLPYDGINPAWKDAFGKLRALVLDKLFPEAESLDEASWNQAKASFSAYVAWRSSKKGAEVEPLGAARVEEILAADGKAALLALVEQDRAVKPEADNIDEVDSFLRLFKNFYRLLRNYVTMDDFYDREAKAIFQAGRLFVDQRSLDLCIRVDDMGKHGDMSKLSGMYIIYCSCVSKSGGKSMNIAAVLTSGDVDSLRVGMNAVFYDRDGLDYDATITKIVDNPVSIRQAFMAPYKKLGRTITEKINKSAADKSAKVDAALNEKANTASLPKTQEELQAAKAAAPAPQPFDIAKISGIFAAIGLGVGMIGSALMKIIDPWYNAVTLIVILVVFISGPSMFIAWQKLRKRNLAPLLNANGWAINARVLVDTTFGSTLTDLAKFPVLESIDPKAARKRRCRRFRNTLIIIILLAAGAFAVCRLTGICGHKDAQEPAVEQECPAEDTAADAVPESVSE